MNQTECNQNYFYTQKMNQIYEKNPQEWRRYTQLHINEVTKFPSRDWDFSKIQFSCLFEINWLHIFPDAEWNLDFSYLSTKTNLEIYWILEHPDAAWDYETLSTHPKFTIAWVDYLPNKPWNFRQMHLYFDRNDRYFRLRDPKSHLNCLADLTYSENFFSIHWINKYPNREWNFSEFHKFNNLSLYWLESYPDKPWNFEEMFRNENFELEWVKRFPDKPWNLDFQKLSSAPNFRIEWIDLYPEAGWDYDRLVDSFKFYLGWVDRYPEKPWDLKKIIRRSIPEDEKWLLKNRDILLKFEEDELRKYFKVRKYTRGPILNLYPGLFNQIDRAIELQDLSGHIYYLENWFTQDDILEYAKQIFPEVGIADIFIDLPKNNYEPENSDSDSDSEPPSEDFLLASQTKVEKFKCYLFQNPEGPQGMIVYV